jgi:hypothetical protein
MPDSQAVSSTLNALEPKPLLVSISCIRVLDLQHPDEFARRYGVNGFAPPPNEGPERTVTFLLALKRSGSADGVSK